MAAPRPRTIHVEAVAITRAQPEARPPMRFRHNEAAPGARRSNVKRPNAVAASSVADSVSSAPAAASSLTLKQISLPMPSSAVTADMKTLTCAALISK